MNPSYVESWTEGDEEELIITAPARQSVNCFLDDAEFGPSDECNQYRLSSQKHLNEIYECMRRKLSYHFMNPIQKWRTKGRCPWKLLVQVIKIIVVTWQMSLFGLRSHDYVQQHRDITLSLSHMLLLDWSPEQTVYPPTSAPYSVYTKPEFYENINYAIKQYSKISELSIASISYDSHNNSLQPLQFCLTHYKQGNIYPFNSTVTIDNLTEESCLFIPAMHPSGDPKWSDFSLENFLALSNISIKFPILVEAKLIFYLKAILPKSLNKLDVPECYRLKNVILYDNLNHDGLMKISFDIFPEKLTCDFQLIKGNSMEDSSYTWRQVLNSIVIVVCIASCILCMRSLYSGQRLCYIASDFFSTHFNVKMTFSEKLDFVDFWYVMIVLSDIFIMSGSVIKIKIEEQHHSGTLYTHCSILLGVGNLFIWVGLLRYLGFFKKYNMLILTLKCALPNVLRFLLCAVLLYAGFCFCGWIVLGPYHVKFESLSRTSECLFAVMNGDDMFSTFVLLNTESNLVWWFSRAYLYAFLLLFIYVVISLFISVIMDTFETIKQFYVHGTPPETTVELFLSASLPRPSTPTLQRIPSPQPSLRLPSPSISIPETRQSRSLGILKSFIAQLLQKMQSL